MKKVNAFVPNLEIGSRLEPRKNVEGEPYAVKCVERFVRSAWMQDRYVEMKFPIHTAIATGLDRP